MCILKGLNNSRKKTLEAMIVNDLCGKARDIWRSVLTDDEREAVSKHFKSETALYRMKDKLSTSQLNAIMKEVSKESFPLRAQIPAYVLSTMETLIATSDFVSTFTTDWLPTGNWLWGTSADPPPVVLKVKKNSKILRESNSEDHSSKGIDIIPVPSGRVKGIHIGAPKKTVNFRVYNESLWARIRYQFTDFFAF